jgi:hypothetical protein
MMANEPYEVRRTSLNGTAPVDVYKTADLEVAVEHARGWYKLALLQPNHRWKVGLYLVYHDKGAMDFQLPLPATKWAAQITSSHEYHKARFLHRARAFGEYPDSIALGALYLRLGTRLEEMDAASAEWETLDTLVGEIGAYIYGDPETRKERA